MPRGCAVVPLDSELPVVSLCHFYEVNPGFGYVGDLVYAVQVYVFFDCGTPVDEIFRIVVYLSDLIPLDDAKPG